MGGAVMETGRDSVPCLPLNEAGDDRFRVALEAAPTGMVMVDARGRHPDFRETFLRAPRARPMGEGRDLYGLRKVGTEVPIEIGLNPVKMDDEEFVLSSVADITERKRAESEREEL